MNKNKGHAHWVYPIFQKKYFSVLALPRSFLRMLSIFQSKRSSVWEGLNGMQSAMNTKAVHNMATKYILIDFCHSKPRILWRFRKIIILWLVNWNWLKTFFKIGFEMKIRITIWTNTFPNFFHLKQRILWRSGKIIILWLRSEIDCKHLFLIEMSLKWKQKCKFKWIPCRLCFVHGNVSLRL